MELSWTTFLLEAINFLILVWLLKRLFYVPVKKAIAARRLAVQQTLEHAEATKQQAEALKAQYEARLHDWEAEKEVQREAFRKELNDERARQMKAIEAAVSAEREKAEALEKEEAAKRRAQVETEAIKQALEFVSRLFHEVASPELEAKIVELVTKHMSAQGGEEFSTFHTGNHVPAVRVRSAYSLSEQQRKSLSAALKQKLGSDIPIGFEVNPKLMAGVEIAAGSVVLRANLRDELEYFAAASNHE